MNQPRDELNGTAVYRDASRNSDGTPHRAAAPDEQSAAVTVLMMGHGMLVDVASPCGADDRFIARYVATMEIDSNDVFTANVDKSNARLVTPSGCAIGDVTNGTLTAVLVRGALVPDATNCSAFCAAQARADAEAGFVASRACVPTCTTRAAAIVGDGTVAPSDLEQLDGIDGDALRTGTIQRLAANIVFDHLEDTSGAALARSIDRREAQM